MIIIRKRLSEKERKQQIQLAAKEVFLDKGFNDTTMDDIVKTSGMSTGGVYHYYKNKFDILYDIMEEGIEYRMEKNKIRDLESSDTIDFVCQILVDRVVDENEFKSLYAMFLKMKLKDSKISEMYNKLKPFNTKMLSSLFDEQDTAKKIFEDDFLLSFINSLIMGYETLGEKETFIQNKEMIKNMVKLYLEEKWRQLNENKK
ncbi:TetR/AcrR family transcriptional regulator [Filifactor alocis]|uniref:TetR/AcrR family transcriptional regulator n=1 Tax=Filifactor alocis TaxID=143361 RepID=UPI0010DAAB0E|nr:HTH-type transcriptional regulator yfiR [Streptococcus pneumoniae]